jgi:hypothetical protein
MWDEGDARDGSSDPQDEFEERTLTDVVQPYSLRLRAFAGMDPSLDFFVQALSDAELDNFDLTWMLIRSNVPTILGFQQGHEEEVMVPDA